jgi:hypothetical protein
LESEEYQLEEPTLAAIEKNSKLIKGYRVGGGVA